MFVSKASLELRIMWAYQEVRKKYCLNISTKHIVWLFIFLFTSLFRKKARQGIKISLSEFRVKVEKTASVIGR